MLLPAIRAEQVMRRTGILRSMLQDIKHEVVAVKPSAKALWTRSSRPEYLPQWAQTRRSWAMIFPRRVMASAVFFSYFSPVPSTLHRRTGLRKWRKGKRKTCHQASTKTQYEFVQQRRESSDIRVRLSRWRISVGGRVIAAVAAILTCLWYLVLYDITWEE